MSADRLQIRKPEVLSPAGSMESVRAAVNAGCDAIYIGGSRFGARAYAKNPREEDMLDVIRYCHRYGVKVYMTVNTVLKERELEGELYDYVAPYYREGLDAVIVQDVGVMNYLHRYFPEMDIHASTQMTLTMGESAAVLEPYGVTRIVPARELTLEELAQMRKAAGVEMEVFVHGALCYCYSGQCLFSSMLGGRSGNRGRCAQPCRQKYFSEENRYAGYLLSPKEHCSLGHIGELMEIGVDSLKLEGRMKRPEYVALTTAMYRKYVDLCASLGSREYRNYLQKNASEWQEDLHKLAELYNRQGFTSGYMEGESGVPYQIKQGRGAMIADKRPNHGGVRVGQVTAVDARTATYRLEREVHAQDVVEFRDNRLRETYEYTLGEDKRKGELVTTRYLKGSRIRKGDTVYRTKDAGLLQEIRERFLAQDRSISVTMHFEAEQDLPMKLCVTAQRSTETFRYEVNGAVCQKAQKSPAARDSLERILCQTGGTAFQTVVCEVSLKGELFIPVGAVKKMRREALEGLLQILESPDTDRRIVTRTVQAPEALPEGNGRDDAASGSPEREPVRKIISVLYKWQAELVLQQKGIHAVYLRTEQMSDEEIRAFVKQGNEKRIRMYLMMPLIFRNTVYQREKEKLKRSGNIYQIKELTGFVIRNMESFVFLTKEAGIPAERIVTDANLYTANTDAIRWWCSQGVQESTIPLELTGKECSTIPCRTDRNAIIYGYIPLMVSAQCIRRRTGGCEMNRGENGSVLKFHDEKNREFAVLNCCKYCYNMIYHGIPLSLEQEKAEYLKMGVRGFRYDFTIEDPQQIREILKGNLPKGQKGHFYLPVD